MPGSYARTWPHAVAQTDSRAIPRYGVSGHRHELLLRSARRPGIDITSINVSSGRRYFPSELLQFRFAAPNRILRYSLCSPWEGCKIMMIEKADFSKLTVLLVDDNAFIRKLLGDILRSF